jgi:hypothetical protein
MRRQISGVVICTVAALSGNAAAAGAQSLGLFTNSSDVGTASTIGPGKAAYDPASKTYTIAGGGENMWAAAAHFHYVW